MSSLLKRSNGTLLPYLELRVYKITTAKIVRVKNNRSVATYNKGT